MMKAAVLTISDTRDEDDDPSGDVLIGLLSEFGATVINRSVVTDDKIGIAEVRQSCLIPIAAGESEFTRFDFRDLINHRAADILQPDLAICGGITETRRIDALANAYNLRLAPHLWAGAPAFFAGLHVAAAEPDQSVAVAGRRHAIAGHRVEVSGQHQERPVAARSAPDHRVAGAQHLALAASLQPVVDPLRDRRFLAGSARDVDQGFQQVGEIVGEHSNGSQGARL